MTIASAGSSSEDESRDEQGVDRDGGWLSAGGKQDDERAAAAGPLAVMRSTTADVRCGIVRRVPGGVRVHGEGRGYR